MRNDAMDAVSRVDSADPVRGKKATIRIVPPVHRGRLARLGDAMARHRRLIVGLQWFVIVFYAVLVALPAFLPAPPAGSTLLTHLTLAAQFAFWGLWWPGVIVATLLFGRIWCGVLCPEGALAEWASRRGRGGAIPRWIRWRGWPLLAFIATTVYGQLISVYEYPQAALLVLGGSTVAAVAVGLAYGRGKRVWCRYLCPVSGVFGLLARVAPVHFKVDKQAWGEYPQHTAAVDCAPLLSVQQMTGAAQCHACGRCSGHRDAVTLSLRSPAEEVLAASVRDVHRVDAWLLMWGLCGVAIGGFRWTADPWFVAVRQIAATWVAEREIWWALESNAPWWVLTHYPELGDAFSWLDGAMILVYIGAVSLVLGGALQLGVWLAGRLSAMAWAVLAMAWIPVAGAGVFVGLSLLTQTQLRAEGVLLPWIDTARALVLGLGWAFSLWLSAKKLAQAPVSLGRRVAAWAAMAAPLGLLAAAWVQQLRGFV